MDIKLIIFLKKNKLKFGGEKGIRTLDTFNSIHAFQAGAFNHSAISPIIFIKTINLIEAKYFFQSEYIKYHHLSEKRIIIINY